MRGVKSPLDPGALHLRITVLEPTSTPDQMGGATVTFSEVRKIWGRFDPAKPDRHTTTPVDDHLARGSVAVRLGEAPSQAARLQWTQGSVVRTFEIEAIEPGTSAFPFDRCAVREIAPEATPGAAP